MKHDNARQAWTETQTRLQQAFNRAVFMKDVAYLEQEIDLAERYINSLPPSNKRFMQGYQLSLLHCLQNQL